MLHVMLWRKDCKVYMILVIYLLYQKTKETLGNEHKVKDIVENEAEKRRSQGAALVTR